MLRKIKKSRNIVAMLLLAISCFFVVPLCAGADAGNVGAENLKNSASLFTAETGITVQGNVGAPKNSAAGFYADGSKDGKTLIKYKSEEDIPEGLRNGVLVSSTTEKNRLIFNNEINLDGKTKDDVLICFQPLSSNPGVSYDFQGLKIYLTDVEDEENYVCIYVYTSGTSYSFMKVELPNGISKAYRYGRYHDVVNVNSQWHYMYENSTQMFFYGYCTYNRINYGDFNYVMEDPDKQIDGGIPKTEMYLAPITLQYDEADKAIWYGNNCLLDLDHTESMGLGKEFSGFTTNRVKLSVVTCDISSSKAQYMIYNVDGQSLNGETVYDVTNPYFIEKLPKGDELPLAGVGREYPLFDVTAYDLVDGALSSEVYFTHESDTQKTLINGSTFIPQKAGKYLITYKTGDRSGNEASIEYTVVAKYGIAGIVISADETQTVYSAGEKIFLPNFTAIGGSGVLNTDIRVVRVADGYNEPIYETDFFQPTVAGYYDVVCSAVDYLGYKAEKTITFKVDVDDSPVFEREIKVNDRFVSGVTTQLPVLAAYDYSETGQRKNAITQITVRGKGAYASVSETLSGYIFEPSLKKYGSEIEIEYKLYCEGKEDSAIIRTYEAKIIEVEQAYDFLAFDETNLSVSLNKDGESEKYTRFTAKKAGSHRIDFIYPMLTEGFEASLNAGSASFTGRVEFCFADAKDSSNTFSIYFSRQDKSSTQIEYGGIEYKMAGAFESSRILISIRENGVYDTTGTWLFDIKESFASPTAWVSVIFHTENVDESICIKKLGTTYFSGSYRKNELQKFHDYVEPTIVFESKLPLVGSYGETILVPAAKAYDNLSPMMEVFVTVTSPDGKVLLSERKATETFSFTLLQYGKYEVAYSATDAAGNIANVVKEVELFDRNAPVIDYVGQTQYTVKTGDSVVLKKFDAYDSEDESLQYRIFIIDTDGKMKEKNNGDSYTFAEKGRYTVRHVAYDTSGNYAILDITVTVQ